MSIIFSVITTFIYMVVSVIFFHYSPNVFEIIIMYFVCMNFHILWELNRK